MVENNDDGKDTKDPKITDTLKKLFTAGVSGALLSEELIRGYLADSKLPKELLQLVLQGAQKSKDEITGRVSKEIMGLLKQVDFAKEVAKFAETHKFRISAEIEVLKKDTTKTS